MKNESLKKISDLINKDLSHLDDEFVVPVGEIAEQIGLEIEFINMQDGHSGRLEGKKIYINDKYPATRNLFTIAHEIGHYILTLHNNSNNTLNCKNRFDDVKTYSSEELKEEKEANEFAANLLMPSEKFINIYQKYDQNIDKIASFFGVSKVACQYRAINLGLIDCI
ncbi:MAG: hypothetical protein RL208_420 [Pseudomonadota bacterium]|jgi:Zn-dependent peptidase ImmA (M78 family)